MKTHLIFSAFYLTMLVSACQKASSPMIADDSNLFAPPASERCGCLPPGVLSAQNITNVSAKLSWEAMPEAIAYRIEVTNGDFGAVDDGFAATHIYETTNINELTLTGLYSSTGYKYRVTTICGSMESVVSPTYYFETKKAVHGDPGYSSKVYSIY